MLYVLLVLNIFLHWAGLVYSNPAMAIASGRFGLGIRIWPLYGSPPFDEAFQQVSRKRIFPNEP
jgi:hypothetical protein